MNGFKQISATQLEFGNTKLDSGFLAELLLFYKSVNIVINKFMLDDLLSFCDFDTLYELVKSKRLNIYLRDNYVAGAIYDQNRFNIQVLGNEGENYRSILFQSINKRLRNSTKTLKLQDKLLEFVNPFVIPPELINMIRGEFKNPEYVKNCLEIFIKTQNRNYNLPSDTFLNFEDAEVFNGFETIRLATNFNFEEINAALKTMGSNAIINTPSLLLGISSSLIDLNISSEFNSHVLSSEISDSLIAAKFENIKRNNKNVFRNVEMFQETVLPEYSRLGDIIRSKEKSFSDLLLILDKAEKFKDWLDNIDEDKGIINEYYNKITEKTWMQSTPGKISRLLVFTATGTIVDSLIGAPIVSPVLSTFDQFLVDNIGRGWTPNRFVDHDLKSFLS